MSTSNEKITIVVEKSEGGYTIYDDTQSFIDFVPTLDEVLHKEIIARVVTSIVMGRIDGTGQASIW